MLLPSAGWSQISEAAPFVSVTVNSAADGPAQPNDRLTLREAIEITNGTLPVSALSEAEQQLVIAQAERSEIRFNLPAGQTAIELQTLLPALTQPGLTVDATTQPGYEPGQSATAEIEIPVPVVVLRPAEGQELFRGLTVSADNITIRGFNLYGFNASREITNATPPADIFISHRPVPLNRATELPFAGDRRSDLPPTGIVIEQNWLGLTATESLPPVPSGFGIVVFDSTGTTISRNRIEYHNGSGVITGRQADNLEVVENILVGNGLAGMPDAIRLDGSVRNGLISSNLICGNDGSGIFLFKPDGAVTISDNDIRFNGQRLRRAAVYLMGSDHRVINNRITNQKGSGVVVTAYGRGPNTQSLNNLIVDNAFENLEGLSIDLNTRRDRAPQDFQRGDGLNPLRNSRNRRQDTGNGAVNAPQFASTDFFIINNTAVLQGKADPNTEIHLYRVSNESEPYGPLSAVVEKTTADSEGNFEFVVSSAIAGERFSAIATDARYGTSEPALNTSVRSPLEDGSEATLSTENIAPEKLENLSQCTTRPEPPTTSVPPTPPPTLPNIPELIQLEVPRNVHFGLDQDFISPESAAVLDQIIEVLKAYPNIVVDLHGHTDSRASVAYNQDLARRRADNTRRYLLSQGIGAERITLRSFGETQLLVEETDIVNFARNRRVEFVFTDLQGADITFFNQEEDLQLER